MNIYLVNAGLMDVYVETIAGQRRYEQENEFEIVAAPTRSKAKQLFLASVGCHSDLEWTSSFSIRKIYECDCNPGIVPYSVQEEMGYWQIIEENNLFVQHSRNL